jgi:hypothetical protein
MSNAERLEHADCRVVAHTVAVVPTDASTLLPTNPLCCHTMASLMYSTSWVPPWLLRPHEDGLCLLLNMPRSSWNSSIVFVLLGIRIKSSHEAPSSESIDMVRPCKAPGVCGNGTTAMGSPVAVKTIIGTPLRLRCSFRSCRMVRKCRYENQIDMILFIC